MVVNLYQQAVGDTVLKGLFFIVALAGLFYDNVIKSTIK